MWCFLELALHKAKNRFDDPLYETSFLTLEYKCIRLKDVCPEISECSAKMLDLRIRIFKLHLLLMLSHAAVTYATLTKVLLKLLLDICYHFKHPRLRCDLEMALQTLSFS